MKKLISQVQLFFSGLTERRLPVFSAAAAYYIFMALVPIVMLMVSLVRFLPITQEQIYIRLGSFMPDQFMTIVKRIVTGIYSGGSVALTISIVLTIIAASGGIRAIMKGLDACYDTERPQNIIIYYARSVFYMIIFLVILLSTFAILMLHENVVDFVQAQFPDLSVSFLTYIDMLSVSRYVILAVILFFAFQLMYTFIPKTSQCFHRQVPGSVFASAGWLIFTWVFSIYINNSNRFGAYGVIGTVMVVMMWIYYSIFVVLIGGWLNRFLELCWLSEHEEH